MTVTRLSIMMADKIKLTAEGRRKVEMDGNKNYDYYDFVVTKLKVIDNVDKQKEEVIK